MQIIDTPETESKYQRLEILGKKLGIPLLSGHLDLQVTRSGKLLATAGSEVTAGPAMPITLSFASWEL